MAQSCLCMPSLVFVTHAGLYARLAQSLMSGKGKADPEGSWCQFLLPFCDLRKSNVEAWLRPTSHVVYMWKLGDQPVAIPVLKVSPCRVPHWVDCCLFLQDKYI